ncbi:galactose mutarotase-like enzyme [Edaphobacter modestus]|uniref:Galactose mutarotase-like enzyme n=2 Tax=Edaphobacter modestus TaxID=388466 RepID=A0A4Q7YP05_9BACT|nr:galactose mutarotase-like enzyme [Edaphobacter modestus]
MLSSRHYILQSEELAVEVRPDEGGRISSLRSLFSGLEFLTQSQRHGSFADPSMDAMFRNGPCAGIEECLPTVAPCSADTEGGPVPDHGDFWQLAWNVSEANGQSLSMWAGGFSRPFRFEKTLTVDRSVLRVAYSVKNIGYSPQSFLYACHPLFAVEAGDRIVLPEEIRSLRLDYSRNDRLGKRGDIVLWPVTHTSVLLDRTTGDGAGTADMFYTGRLSNGACSIHRAAMGEKLDVVFNTDTLPYLGVWLCYGGWPEDASTYQQYAVALEPTTSPHNRLTEAQQAGAAINLAAGAAYNFSVSFRIGRS